jgi:hypothetical protein
MSSEGDLTSEAGVLAYADGLMSLLREMLAETGSIPTGIACLATCRDGQRLDNPVPVIVLLDQVTLSSRGPSSAALHAMVRDFRAIGVFFFSESWIVDFESEAEHDAWRERSWADHPRAQEMVTLFLEHRRLATRSWRAQINRDAEGKPTLASFQPDPPVVKIRGRFSQFLSFPEEEPPHHVS